MATIYLFAMIVFVMVIIGFITHFIFAAKIFGLVNRTFETSLDQLEQHNQMAQSELKKDFQCKQCGAQLKNLTDISPSGDFRCPYCQSISNVHS